MGLRKYAPAISSSRGILLVILVTFLVYLPTFSNGFTNWDDEGYVTANPFVQRLTATNLLHHATSFTSGNYQPLTLLAYSLQYRAFGPDPRLFHGVSLLFHLFNVLFVYLLAVGLGASPRASLVAASLFGIHPLHVESVAWISELKDVLSTFLFLAAILAYLKYCRQQRRSLWYGLSLGLFLLSLLSKPMGVSLPFVLLLCDFLRGRRWEVKTFFDKVPFFLLALGFGALALLSQKTALHDGDGFRPGENLLVASHGLLFYLARMVVPVNLSALYLLPARVNGQLPAAFTSAPLLVLTLAALAAFLGRRSKTLIFVGAYTLITLLPVLQIVPFGSAAAADRYFYLPSFGLCFAAGMGYSWLENLAASRPRPARILLPLAGAALLVVYSGLAWERIRVWKDSFTLWNDVVAKDPGSFVAYGFRGMAYAAAGADEPALADFNRALELGGDRYFSAQVLFKRGALFQGRRQFPEAMADYDRALAIDPGMVAVLENRGNVLDMLGRTGEALSAYTYGLSLEPGNAQLYYNRGLVYQRTGDDPKAIFDYGEALNREPDFAPALINRGIVLARMRRFAPAIADFTRAAALAPTLATIYENRGNAYAAVGDLGRAELDRERARSLTSDNGVAAH